MVVEGTCLPDLGASLATGVDTRVSGVGGSEACPRPAGGRVPKREVLVSCGGLSSLGVEGVGSASIASGLPTGLLSLSGVGDWLSLSCLTRLTLSGRGMLQKGYLQHKI